MERALLDVALDLAANLAAEDRYRRLAAAVRRVVPCDATAMLELRDGVLVPVVASGLQPDVLGRRFIPADHPRLVRLLAAEGPVRFTGSDLPDPFDGLFLGHEVTTRAHACMGSPLRVEGTVIGALAMDAVDPAAFDAVDDGSVAMLAALAGAAMRTAGLIGALESAAARQGLVARQLLHDRRQQAGAGGILGASAAVRRVRDEVALIAGSDLPVLITGETGVGKDVVAHAVHAQSARRDQAVIQVNCAALPEGLAESELFGHVRGAFTGATDTRAGKFEVADGGTLFLDEVGELPLAVQPKLLRAIQSGEVQRVGADRPVRVDVRIVAATNRDLADEVRAGRFRSDLFHRLAVYPLHLPPLRERPEDVPVLAGHFLDRARARLGLGDVRLTAAAHEALSAYDWPGNVRELDHVVLRAALRASAGRRHETVVVDAAHLALGAGGGAAGPASGA
ncbi:MAG: nitric oxide reductase transcriptional regulator NorR, partial [Deltaproteobacteria bacterium]|nr:nitric oxide reductase transcriptional regulator NorR [Deltaproteobacteria bacterium]